ncbi:MAG: ion channel [Proteobacteria bacterium]|nr:ion channel [Pseudomonadota bacterium]
MIALTVVIHTAGIIGLVAYFKAFSSRVVGKWKYIAMMRILMITIVGIFIVHTVEIWIWAVLYRWLGEFESMERALYFSTVTFTTLGYGDITLQERWQLLSSFEAANGIILFGVSTAFVFVAIRKLFEVTEIIKAENV